MAGGGQASAGAIPPIVTRVGKEVDALDGGEDFEGGLGVGGEPLLVWGAGSPKPFCLQPSLRGEGLVPGEKPSSIVDGAIRTSRGWAVAHHFYPRITNSYVSLRKNDDEDVNRFAGRFGVG